MLTCGVLTVAAAGLDPNRHIEFLPSIDFSKLILLQLIPALKLSHIPQPYSTTIDTSLNTADATGCICGLSLTVQGHCWCKN